MIAFEDKRAQEVNRYASQLVKELILPKLIREVNTGKKYAELRQVYYSFILAQWFKQRFRGSRGYYPQFIDSKVLYGLTSKEKWSKERYFKEYQRSCLRGEYSLNETFHDAYGKRVRLYFSGGLNLNVPIPQAGGSVQAQGPVVVIDGAVGGVLSADNSVVEAEIQPGPGVDLKGKVILYTSDNPAPVFFQSDAPTPPATPEPPHVPVEDTSSQDSGGARQAIRRWAPAALLVGILAAMAALAPVWLPAVSSTISVIASFFQVTPPSTPAVPGQAQQQTGLAFGLAQAVSTAVAFVQANPLQTGVIIAVILGTTTIIFTIYRNWKKRRAAAATVQNHPVHVALATSTNGNGRMSVDRKLILQNVRQLIKKDTLNEFDLSTIINAFEHIIRTTRLSVENAFGSEREIIRDEQQEALEVLQQLTEKLLAQLRRGDIPGGISQEKIRWSIRVLLAMSRYFLEYRTLLEGAKAFSMFNKYFLAKSEFIERVKLMFVIRLLWGMQFGMMGGRRLVRRQIPKVILLGKQIESLLTDDAKIEQPLYPSIDEVRAEFEDYIASALAKDPATYKQMGASKLWELDREWISRFIPLLLALRPLLEQTRYWLGQAQNPVDVAKVAESFALGIGLSWAISWSTVVPALMKSSYYKTTLNQVTRLEDAFVEAGGNLAVEDHSVLLLREEYANTVRALQEEVRVPRSHLIVVMTDSEERAQQLGNYFARTRGILWPSQIPLLCLSYGGRGDGMAMLEAFRYLRSQEFAQRFPHLTGIPLTELRVPVLIVEGDNFERMLQPLPFEPYAQLGRPFSGLELWLLNGFKAMQAAAHDSKGVFALLRAEGVYLGSLASVGSNAITMLALPTTRREVAEQRMPAFLADIWRTGKIWKFYDGLSGLEHVKNPLEKKMLGTVFGEEIPAFADSALISFDDQEQFAHFMARLERMQKFVDRYSRQHNMSHPRLSLIRDILIPLVMLFNKEDPADYKQARMKRMGRMLGGTVPRPIFEFFDGFFYEAFGFVRYNHEGQEVPFGSYDEERMARSLPQDALNNANGNGIEVDMRVFEAFSEASSFILMDGSIIAEEHLRRLSRRLFDKEIVLVMPLEYYTGPQQGPVVSPPDAASPLTHAQDPAERPLGHDQPGGRAVGGIDFRSMPLDPVVPQPILNRSNPLPYRVRNIEKEMEQIWLLVQRGLDNGIVPSTELLRYYVGLSCSDQATRLHAQRAFACVVGVLRLQEELLIPTEPAFMDVLGMLTAGVHRN